MLASPATAGQATFEPDELDEPDLPEELPEPDEELEAAELLSPELPLLELLFSDDPDELDESLLDELPEDSPDVPAFSLSLLPPLAVTEPFRLSVR
jgi:hypothetical protein